MSELGARETLIILAALRCLQRQLERTQGVGMPIYELLSDDGAPYVLQGELDALCETINFATITVTP